MEDDLETTQQCDPAVSDSDSGGSLFMTQSVSSAERKVQRRCSPRKPSLPYGQNYRDESESEEDGEAEPEQGPDTLLLRVSDSDSAVSGHTAIKNKSPSPEPQGDRVRRRPRVYVTPARPRRMKFPFLKSRFERLTVSKNQILVNSEVGGFFKAVKKLGEGHSKKRRELSPTSKKRGRKLENDSMEEDNTDGDEDIRIVDAACFISKKTISKTPRKMNLSEKSKKGQKKENQKKTRKQNEQRSSRPPKGARRLTGSRDALSKSHSTGLKVSQRKGGKGETKSRKSARISTAVSKVIRTLLADLEEHGQKEPEILVTGSQSQPIDDCWPTQDGNSASEMSLGGSDDETMVQETQWPGLTGQSEEGCQSGATEEGEELCVGDGSFREKDKDRNRSENEDLRLESAPDPTIDRTMVASPLKKSRIVNRNKNALESRSITRSLSQRSCLSTPEKTASLKEDAVSSRASENLIESLKVKYGLYAQIKIPLVDCLAVQADNAITLSQKEEMKQQTQAEEENVEMESCHIGTMVVNQDFEKETMEDGQKKERNISDNEEQREDVSRSAELGEMQTTPPSSPIKTTVRLQGSFGVGGSSSDESLHNEDVALDSGHHTSSQDLFEETNNQADVTVVSSSFIEFITTSDDEDPQENATQCDESKKENGDSRSEILNTEAEYLERTPECHAPELSENQDTVAHVGGAFVECPSGSNVIGASSPSKDIFMDKQGQETQIDAVESPLFNLGGVKRLQRKTRKKVKVSQGHNPPQTYQEHLHESFIPSHDVSKQKKSEKDKGKDDERNDTLTFSVEPAGTLPKNGDPVDPILSDEHSDAPSAGGCVIKTNERNSEDEDTHIPCPSSRSLASIAVHLMRPCPSHQQDSGTEIQKEARKELLSDGSETENTRKKKAKKRRLSEVSGFGTIETDLERQKETIIAATGTPSPSLAEPLDNSHILSSTEIQPVMCQSQQAGQDSEAQSTDDCGVKVKKKDKNKESSLTIWAGQDEDPKQNSSTEVHSQESSKDLVQSDGSEPLKKKRRKKAKEKAIADDTITLHHAEQSQSVNDTAEINDGERLEQEMPSEYLVSMTDGSTQLTQSGRFSPQFTSTQVHSEDRNYLDLSDGSSPVKKKTAKKKDSPDDMVTLQSEEQSMSGYGATETNSGEAQGEEIITTTEPPSKILAEQLMDNCDVTSSIEFQQVMFQDLQAGQDSVAQSTDECWVKGKRKKKKDKHKESFTMKTGQDEDPQMPSPSSECMVSIAGHGKLMRTDTSSQQDYSTAIQSQGSSKDLLIPSVGSEPVKEKKRKKPKKKIISDDMIALKSEEQSKSGNDSTETNTEENQRQKIITEKEKKKKKDKHKESSLTIRTDQDEDPQMPSQESSKDLIPFDSSEPVKKKKRKKAKDKPVSDDMVTLQSEEQSKSGNNTTAGNGGERQEEEMPSECLVSMAEGSTQLTQSGPFSPQYSNTQVHTEVSKELVLSDGSEAVKTKKKKKAKEKDSPDNVVTVQFEEQSTNSGDAEEVQFTVNCGVKVKKKKKNAKHKESSSTVWTSQHEDPRMSSPSSECQSSMASGPDLLQYNIRSEVHRELKTSDGLQTIKKKKAKKREQSKSGYCITESTAGENEGEEIIPATSPFETNCVISSTIEIQPVMCQALQAGPDSEAQSNENCGAKMKKKKKKHKPMESSEGQDEDQKLLSSSSEHWSSTLSHQDSSTEVHKVLVPCDGSVPIKKTKKKKKYISDDMVTLQHAEKSKSCCDTTAEKTQEEEIITASRELTEDHGIKVKKKKKKDKHDDDNPMTDGSEPLKKKKKEKEQQKELVTLEDAEHSESGHGSSKSKFGERPEEDMVSASRVSVEDHGIKGKKKRKKDITSDLVSIDEGFYQLSGTDPRDNDLRQKDGSTEVEKGSKDLGSKPLGKKKRKKMDWSVDMVSLHCAENPEPSCDATKVKTGKKKDRKKELFVEDSSENITPTNHQSENPVSLPASDLVTPRKKKKKWQEQTEQSQVVDTVEQLVTQEQQDTEVKKKKKKDKSSYKSVV